MGTLSDTSGASFSPRGKKKKKIYNFWWTHFFRYRQ
jgi:hypothetical protein